MKSSFFTRPAGSLPARFAPALAVLLLLALLSALILILRPAANGAYDPANVARSQPVEAGPGQPSIELPARSSSGAQPAVSLQSDYFDFGLVGTGKVLEREFILYNDGAGDLVIGRAYTTCGCTTASISSAVIPPGKLAVITLRFDPGFHNVSGTTVRRGLILETNDPRQPVQEVWVQAEVR